MRALLAGALATAAALTTPALASAALTGPQQIAFLNAQRAANGLPADVVENPLWSADCATHMNYLAATGKFQHHEDKADPQYTDAGDLAGTTAVLSSAGDAFSATGVNAFETAPIHLSQMLSPYLRESGADRGCLATQRDTERTFLTPTTFSYPGDGRTNVPVSEVSYEDPFVPAAAVGLSPPGDLAHSVRTGPSLYFFYASTALKFGRFFGKGTITAKSLTGPDGPVDVRSVDNATPAPDGSGVLLGDYLPPGGILIPAAPLKKDSTYTASVTFQPKAESGEPAITRTWRFSTGNSLGSAGGAGGSGGTGGAGGAGGTGGTGTTPSVTLPTVSKVKLKKRSVAFESSVASALWVTVEKRLPRKGKKTRWSSKRSFAAAAALGANRFTIDKLPKATYRVRVRGDSATGKIVFERTLTLR